MDTENQTDAQSHTDNQTTQAPPAPPASPQKDQKFEVKDGAMLVGGRKVVYESDLIAAKESLKQQMEQAQTVHNSAVDKARLDLSEAQTQLAAANAKVQQLSQARQAGAVSDEEAARQKQEVEAAKSRAGQAETNALDLRKKLLIASYPGQLTEEQLKDKTPEQLTALDEALRTVTASRTGPGPYAVGGGAGATTPMSDMDRAKTLLNTTPYRGVREPAPQQ